MISKKKVSRKKWTSTTTTSSSLPPSRSLLRALHFVSLKRRISFSKDGFVIINKKKCVIEVVKSASFQYLPISKERVVGADFFVIFDGKDFYVIPVSSIELGFKRVGINRSVMLLCKNTKLKFGGV